MEESKNLNSGNDSQEFDLDSFIESLGIASDQPNNGENDEPPVSAKFDPNATMAYSAAGEDFPELPFANEKVAAGVSTSADAAARAKSRASSAAIVAEDIEANRNRNTKTPRLKDRQAGGEQDQQAGRPAGQLADQSGQTWHSGMPERREHSSNLARLDHPERRQQMAQTERSGRPDNPLQSAAKKLSQRVSNAIGTAGIGATDPANSRTETRTVHNPLDNSEFNFSGSPFKPLDINSSTYKIRGGGSAQARSPLVNGVLVIVVVLGIIALGWGVFNVANMLAGTASGASINLTSAQTRDAIDQQLPVLTKVVDVSSTETLETLAASGQQLFTNSRYRPDAPDTTADGTETISFPAAISENQIQGFYEATYNAYTPEELQDYFNGAYVLDMVTGEMGDWNKLKYVNLNATSVDDEIAQLRKLQALDGDGAIAAEQGTDTRGNTVVQGTKAVGEKIYYWKVAACPFTEVYTTAKLSSNAVYATCTVATYDFYTGADTITPK